MSNRKLPTSVKWRVDQDYEHKLSDEEKEWLRKFNSEFYNAFFSGDKDLHPDRKECYRAKNAARRDVVTAHGDQVAEQQRPAQPSSTRSNYSAKDYLKTESDNVEDALVNYLDDKHNFRFTN